MKQKRLTALMISLTMLSCPIGCFKTIISFSSTLEAQSLDILDSGTCEDTLNWELDSEGTLTISGKGKMKNYAFVGIKPPWDKYYKTIKKVIISNEIENIGKYAFFDFPNLTSISIPNSVTSIGECAFENCKSLESVTISNSVTNIESSAFASCQSLESIIIPDSIKSIEYGTFAGCTKLKSITIPDSVVSIEGYAFEGTSWLKSKQEDPLVIVNNILINGTTCSGNVVIPSSVTSISGSAFEKCTSLESINIPDSVKSIESSTFYGCTNLESIILSNALTNIGSFAFNSCTNLKSITIPDSVTNIGDHAFFDCESLKSMVIPNSVVNIGKGAFSSCDNMESMTILNPECEIGKDDIVPISSKVIIKGYKGSTAEDYANKGYYTFIALGDAPTAKKTYGDANGDGDVTVADAVAILQYIGNKDKYNLSEQGKKNADVDGVAGITGRDALVLQQVDAGLIKLEDLPLKTNA